MLISPALMLIAALQVGPADANAPAPLPPQSAPRPDQLQSGPSTRVFNAPLADEARFDAIHVERKHRMRVALLGPADHPAERGLAALGSEQPRLGADNAVTDLGDR